ncbi:Major facilitator superfamily domain-containing protein 1 [Thelohanellus kitauei]|uniref:Lysosomal dipeptide transporter MFSD1 n=1 Tax=Thelohanellus kitauei TaxID=669202 RepID=A0A0C2MRW5_THEKT|nr:Major facilitator superfamily domain-containing protein 1 [Thelohanellus kitauei]
MCNNTEFTESQTKLLMSLTHLLNDVADSETPHSDGSEESHLNIRQNTPTKFQKITFVILLCLTFGGLRFCFHSYIPFQDIIVENLNLTEFQYNALSSFRATPNIVFPIFGGYIIGKFGHQLCAILSAILCLVSQILLCCGVSQKMYSLIVVSQLILGIGGESLAICISTYTMHWFTGEYVPLVMGLEWSTSSIMTFSSMFFSRVLFVKISNKFTDLAPMKVASMIIGISVLMSCGSTLLSYGAFLLDKNVSNSQRENTDAPESGDNDDSISLSSITKFTGTFWCLSAFSMVLAFPSSSYVSISP